MSEHKQCTTVIYLPDGEPSMKCPHCGDFATVDDCDVNGADEDCLFCNSCNKEFMVPGTLPASPTR